MKIGPKFAAASAISAANPHTIVMRGFDLVEDLIDQIGFSDYVWLLAAGARPNGPQRSLRLPRGVAQAVAGPQSPSRNRRRRSRFNNLPLGFFGRLSTNTTRLGVLKGAIA